MGYELVPLRQREARSWVAQHHRHSGPPRGDLFRVGLSLGGGLVAVGVAGRPIGRGLDDGRTIEIVRVCTNGEQHENACSRLYGALCRAGAALGFERAYTYTLESENAASVRASGFRLDAQIGERSWADERGRAVTLWGDESTPQVPKSRWVRYLRGGGHCTTGEYHARL